MDTRGKKVVDILTKQGSRHEVLEDILRRNEFEHAQSEDNLVTYEETGYTEG